MFTFRFLAASLVLFFFSSISNAEPGKTPFAKIPDCSRAVPADPDSILRSSAELIRFDLPSPGFLTLEISAPAAREANPGIDPISTCSEAPGTGTSIVLLERAPTRLAVAVRSAGTYFFRAAVRDPHRPFASYKLVTSFVRAQVREEEVVLASGARAVRAHFYLTGPTVLKDHEAHEVDPDPLVAPPAAGPASIVLLYGADAPAIDAPMLRLPIPSRCRYGEGDDHGDSFACATPIRSGHESAGEIGNDWGDDEDVFTFMLNEMRTVRIETSGEIESYFSLFDRFGQELATHERVDGTPVVKTLLAGRYFLRIAATGQGPYRFRVETFRNSSGFDDQIGFEISRLLRTPTQPLPRQ